MLSLNPRIFRRFSAEDINPTVFYLSLLAIITIVVVFKLNYLSLDIVKTGWSPVDFARHLNEIPNFSNDFKAGYEKSYAASAPMLLFPYLYKWTPEYINLFMYIYVGIIQSLLAISLAYFAQSLFKDRLTTLAIVSTGLISPLMGVNLANLGSGLQFPSFAFYNFYHVFVFLALGTWVNKKYLLTSVCLIVCLYTHPILGIYTIAAFFIMTLFECYRTRNFRFAILPTALLGLFFVLRMSSLYSNLGTHLLPENTWLIATRLFNWHYYGISMGFFDSLSMLIGLPFLCVTLFAIPVYLILRSQNPLLHDALAMAVGISLIIGITGLFLSEYTSSRFIITLNMQRATELSSFICFSYIIALVVRLIKNNSARFAVTSHILPILFIVIFLFCYKNLFNEKKYAPLRSVYETQLWLKNNTPIKSVFMTNPVSYMGWREYSERSYFGSFTEWAHTSILYSADPNDFNEAMRRSALFGFSFDDFTQEEIKSQAVTKMGRAITNDLSDRFLGMSAEQIATLMEENNVDYLVLKKEEASKINHLGQPIYRNNDYQIYSLHDMRLSI